MSFSLTTPQFKARTKTVTRRLGWKNLRPGDRIMAVEKGMGLKKGEKVVRLGEIEVLSCRREPLFDITPEDIVKEGFPNLTYLDFIRLFTSHNNCWADTTVTRIEFKYL